jgi:hypothetical protein
MGKLTDSLKATTKQLGEIKQGIQQMQALGHELADNTLNVADAALRTGYAYAKAEAEVAQPALIALPALPGAPTIPDADQLNGGVWTEAKLKQRFGKLQAARQYLHEQYNVTSQPRSWKAAIALFNDLESTPDCSIEQRLTQLEQAVSQQQQQLAILMAQLGRVLQHLETHLETRSGAASGR